MQVQRTSRRRERQIAERGAALQHFFSKAVVQASPNGLSLNRSFAATPFDVSVADKDETALAVGALEAIVAR
jgi:hypothetical protein